MPKTVLPDGRKVECLSRLETQVVWGHVGEYFKHGITLSRGDTVVDVGANIGLFTLAAWERCGPTGTLYAFEPIPAVFEVLERNIRRHRLANVHAWCRGLSRRRATVVFTYYPLMPVVSTAYPEGWQQELHALFVANPEELPPPLRWLRHCPRSPRAAIIHLLLLYFLQHQQVSAEVVRLSEVLDEQGIERVDLLKVDAEKSELDVLLGLDAEDWPKIAQVVAEVHDIDGRITRLTALLHRHGFQQVLTEQEPGYRDSNIFNLYALR